MRWKGASLAPLQPGEEMVGMEILDTSRHLGFPKDSPRMETENVKAWAEERTMATSPENSISYGAAI